MQTADVVVIGGGVNGASAAMHLARRGAGKVVLVERGHLASGATGRSAAMIRELYSHPTLVRMATESSAVFRNFAEEVGGDAGFRRSGRVLLFGETDKSAAEATVAMNRELGVDVSLISPAEVGEILPQAHLDDVAVGIWEPGSGYADPVATTYAFAAEARRHGAEILTNTAATGFRVEGGRLKGVVTAAGVIETQTALNATGAWGNLLGDTVFPIRPTRVQVVRLRRPPALESLTVNVIDHVTGANFRAEDGWCTRIGGEAEEDLGETVNPDQFGLNADHHVIERYWSRARHRFPDFDRGVCLGGFGAIYDITPDGNPVLDHSSQVEGLYFAVGFSGHGFKLSPVVGRMIAELIMEGQAKGHDVRQFRLSRFAEGDFLQPEDQIGTPAHP